MPAQGGTAARRRWPGSCAGLCRGGPGARRATPHDRQINAARTSCRPVRAQPSCLTAHSSARSWPLPGQDPEASTLASARESPGACETQRGLPQAGTAREATEAAARSPGNPGMDDRRSRGRSAHTRRCSRPRYGRSRCGPAGGAGPHRCRGRADRRAGVSRPPQARFAGTGHGDRGDAVRRQRPDGQPARYPSRGQRRQDCSLNSPPGSRSCHYRGLEQRRCYDQTIHAGRAKDMPGRDT